MAERPIYGVVFNPKGVRWNFGDPLAAGDLPSDMKIGRRVAWGKFKLEAHYPNVNPGIDEAGLKHTEVKKGDYDTRKAAQDAFKAKWKGVRWTAATKKAYIDRRVADGSFCRYYEDNSPYFLARTVWDSGVMPGVHLMTKTKDGRTVRFAVAPSSKSQNSITLIGSMVVPLADDPDGGAILCSGPVATLTAKGDDNEFKLDKWDKHGIECPKTYKPEEDEPAVQIDDQVPPKYRYKKKELKESRKWKGLEWCPPDERLDYSYNQQATNYKEAEEEMIKVSATLLPDFWEDILNGDESINEVDWEIESAETFNAESDYKKAYNRLRDVLYDDIMSRDIEDSCNCEYLTDEKLESGEITMEEAESGSFRCPYCEVMNVFEEYGAETFNAISSHRNRKGHFTGHQSVHNNDTGQFMPKGAETFEAKSITKPMRESIFIELPVREHDTYSNKTNHYTTTFHLSLNSNFKIEGQNKPPKTGLLEPATPLLSSATLYINGNSNVIDMPYKELVDKIKSAFEGNSMNAEDEITVDEMNERVQNLGSKTYFEFCYRFDIDPEDAQEMSWFIADHHDAPKVISWLKDNADKYDAESFESQSAGDQIISWEEDGYSSASMPPSNVHFGAENKTASQKDIKENWKRHELRVKEGIEGQKQSWGAKWPQQEKRLIGAGYLPPKGYTDSREDYEKGFHWGFKHGMENDLATHVRSKEAGIPSGMGKYKKEGWTVYTEAGAIDGYETAGWRLEGNTDSRFV